MRRLRPLQQGWAICPAFCAIKHAVLQGLVSRAPLLYFGPASVGARKQLADIYIYMVIVKTGLNFFKSLSLFSSKMEDNTHTSKQAYVRQPHPSQTTYKPHETKRPQPTRLYETKVPCGAAYIIWPRKAVSLNICVCQHCTPTKPNTFSTDHAPPRNTTSYRQAATNCSTLHQGRHFTARPLLVRSLRTGVRKKSGFQMI